MAFDWTPPKSPEEHPSIRNISPIDVLYELDEPILFSAATPSFSILCYKLDADPPTSQYMVVPTNERIIRDLRNGRMALRAALTQAWSWLVEAADADFQVVRSWVIDAHDLPETMLPQENLSLYYQHGYVGTNRAEAPYLSIKFKGGDVKNGTIPFGVIKMSIDEAFKSVWRIFSPGIQNAARNLKEQTLRRIVNIPTYEISYGSLMIEFERPEVDLSRMKTQPEIDIDLAARNIDSAHAAFLESTQALAAAVRGNHLSESLASDNFDAIEAVAELVPGYNSFFDSVEINGRRPDRIIKPLIIDAQHGQIIKQIYESTRDSLRTVSGEVFLINSNSYQFTIRTGYGEVTCVATTDAQKDAVAVLKSGNRIEARGLLQRRTYRDLLRMQFFRIDGRTIA